MLEKMEGKLGDNHAGELHRETASAQADRILGEDARKLAEELRQSESEQSFSLLSFSIKHLES
jgi:hypothetical protein